MAEIMKTTVTQEDSEIVRILEDLNARALELNPALPLSMQAFEEAKNGMNSYAHYRVIQAVVPLSIATNGTTNS